MKVEPLLGLLSTVMAPLGGQIGPRVAGVDHWRVLLAASVDPGDGFRRILAAVLGGDALGQLVLLVPGEIDLAGKYGQGGLHF